MTSPSPSPETSSVGSQTEIERLVDELVKQIISVAELHKRSFLLRIALLDAREAAFDAARSSLLKYVSDRMLTADDARRLVELIERTPMTYPPELTVLYKRLRLRSNDAR